MKKDKKKTKWKNKKHQQQGSLQKTATDFTPKQGCCKCIAENKLARQKLSQFHHIQMYMYLVPECSACNQGSKNSGLN